MADQLATARHVRSPAFAAFALPGEDWQLMLPEESDMRFGAGQMAKHDPPIQQIPPANPPAVHKKCWLELENAQIFWGPRRLADCVMVCAMLPMR